MNQEDKQKEAWQKQLAEDWMIEMNHITAQLLNETRLKLMTVFPIKKIEITCDPAKFTMTYNCKLNFWKSLFRKRSLIKQIHARLAEKYKNYEITVNCI